ncbi:RNA recognition motif domain-containing protein [Paludibacter jiangxiensis]|uniref:RNA recognition motif n=1 Tax=Paludibacter jiangxiensis TaxID=681398 RepID=A0A170ZXW0_9BACT|nr:RNA-binding protein [Paludibacter jiangxiensis]GAT63123.1 RNA recognition motif [Paludibacter jiangxiensis]
MNIYVSNLSDDTTNDSLEELFEEYGIVTGVKVMVDRMTGYPKGCGFVEMPNDIHGQRAIDNLHDTEFEGNKISVSVARPKTEQNNRGYGNRGGYNGGHNSGYNGGYNQRRY